jgi:hypothetical protein
MDDFPLPVLVLMVLSFGWLFISIARDIIPDARRFNLRSVLAVMTVAAVLLAVVGFILRK